jgi:hypothetical protein
MLCLPIAPSKSIYKSCIRFRNICIFHFLWIFLPSFFRSKQLMHGYAIVSGLLCSPYGFKSLSVGYGLPWLFRSKRLIILSIFWRELQLRVCWCTYLTCCAPKITSWTSTLLVVNYLKLTFIYLHKVIWDMLVLFHIAKTFQVFSMKWYIYHQRKRRKWYGLFISCLCSERVLGNQEGLAKETVAELLPENGEVILTNVVLSLNRKKIC